jgi:hypothetical protein
MSKPVIQVVSDEEAETVDLVVCVRKGSLDEKRLPQWWKDTNIEGVCSLCDHAIIFRPYNPVKPPKVCVECALELGKATVQ